MDQSPSGMALAATRAIHRSRDEFAAALRMVAAAYEERPLALVDLIEPRRLRVRLVEPIGVVAIVAMASTHTADYAKHLALAVFLGNELLLAPIRADHAVVASSAAAAFPDSIRVEGADAHAPIRPVRRFVTLGHGVFRIENRPWREEAHGPDGIDQLRSVYSRSHTRTFTVRSNLRPPVDSWRSLRP